MFVFANILFHFDIKKLINLKGNNFDMTVNMAINIVFRGNNRLHDSVKIWQRDSSFLVILCMISNMVPACKIPDNTMYTSTKIVSLQPTAKFSKPFKKKNDEEWKALRHSHQ